jgi:cytochrome c-type biogenesis protein
MSTAAARWAVMLHALLFVIGLIFVLVVVVGGLAGAFSFFLREHRRTMQYIFGALLIVFGLHMMGAINIPFLNYTRRLELRPAENLGYLRSLLIGMAFGIGWTPCIGPVLTGIFGLSSSGEQGQAFVLFLAYGLGLGLPFLVAAAAMGRISGWLKKITRRSLTIKIGGWTVLRQVNLVSLISGLLLVFMGGLIFTNWLTILTPQISLFEGL